MESSFVSARCTESLQSSYVRLAGLHEQRKQFAKQWDNNLRLQGFAEAFERQQTPRAYACPVQPGFWHLGHHSGKTQKQKELWSSVELTRPKIEEGRDNQSQIRDEQSNISEQESLRGEFLTENIIENLDSLNETTQFDDWIPDFDDGPEDDDPEFDGDCNESQPCRGDEYCDDGYDDQVLTPPISRLRVRLQLWWCPVKGVVRRYLRSRFSWFRRGQVNIAKQNDSGIPF